MSNKKTNHLGSHSDKLTHAGHHLPSLNKRLTQLQQATTELKLVFTDCLPEEILTNCWVVNVSPTSVTLAVNSMTAVNHISYMKQVYLKILKEQSTSFTQIEELKVIFANF